MQLAVFFLASLALAAASPLHTQDLESDLAFLEDNISLYSEGGGRIGERLRDLFENLVEKLRKTIEDGRQVRSDLLKKAQDLYEKLKNMGVELGDKVKEVFEKIKDGFNKERADEQHSIFNFKERLRQIRDLIQDKFDVDKIKAKITETFGDDSLIGKQLQDFLDKHGEKSKQKLIDFINRFVGDEDEETVLMHSDVEQSIFNIKDRLRQLRDLIRDKFDVEKVKAKITETFGEDSLIGKQFQDFLDKHGEKAKQKLIDFINRFIGEEEEAVIMQGDVALSIFNIKERLRQLRDLVREKFDVAKIKQRINDMFGEDSMMGRQLNDLVDKHGEKAKQRLLDFLDRIIGDDEEFSPEIQESMIQEGIFNIKENLKKLRDFIKEKYDKDRIKKEIDDFFGDNYMGRQLQGIVDKYGDNARDMLLNFIERFIGKDEEKRSIKEVFDKIRDYFKDLGIEIRERFAKFGEYVKEQYQKVVDKTKTKAENVRRIAKEFLEDSRKIGKDMAEEALEFFKQYKEDLGRVFDDINEKVKQIIDS